jgi:hypothetical protein
MERLRERVLLGGSMGAVMRTDVIAIAAAVSVLTLFPAHPGSSQSFSSTTTAETGAAPLSLVGCVSVEDTAGRDLTIADRTRRIRFRPKPVDLDADTGRLRVVGAFMPTANIAAQAGSIDPTIPAMAMAGAVPTGTGATRTGYTRRIEAYARSAATHRFCGGAATAR